MDDITIELRNREALSRAEARSLVPPEEATLCRTCRGTGVVPETETEHLWGDPCPEGCRLDLERVKGR